MPALVLMYHRTPKGSAEGFYDVPLPALREQIERLIDAGVRFVRFSEVNSPASLSEETKVALTFDDGHASNAAAFEYLYGRDIVPAAMIVRDWSERDSDFLDAPAIAALAEICEFGAHGASHIALSSLDTPALDDELSRSRAYLEDILGSEVLTMALPGGMGSARVRRRALAQGYRLIGDSRPLRHDRAGPCVPRIAITRETAAQEPLFLARAGSAFWLRRRVRAAVSHYGPRLVGSGAYAALTRRFK
jgi:peptidoglycan/xylan/chitin deacetylase (PgdA/CDA1 family)